MPAVLWKHIYDEMIQVKVAQSNSIPNLKASDVGDAFRFIRYLQI